MILAKNMITVEKNPFIIHSSKILQNTMYTNNPITTQPL